MRRLEEPMEEQKRVNEERDKNNQRQETEEITRREKVDESIQGDENTRRHCHQPKPVEERNTQKKGEQKMTKERNIKTENTFSVIQEEDTEPLRKEEKPPKLAKNIKIKSM